ncbi:DNA-processing protein DprA [Metasolibacillus meyeri]|uniref:DNA-processing protein DprA n=1 Tax=Metasolibacillus meyeri TaxID=1071052 RepID=UPI000D30B550|nr:DNA-processing protein DprA [Metasolibacillus meyeri]
MQSQEEIQQLLALHYVYPLPLNKLQRLLYEIETLQQLPLISAKELAKILQIQLQTAQTLQINYNKAVKTSFKAYYEQCSIHAIPFLSEHYPKSLLQLHDAPTVIYARGRLDLLQQIRKIACIGSRNATNYSTIALQSILPPLIAEQYVIVSGLAKGADTLAHRMTIELGGQTIAVVGHGFAHIYPKENKQLTAKIAEEHLLLTEYPPYMGPKKWHFPMRNRIISGLSCALVVTEAAMKSGTLITTDHALEHGKDVFVVPGPIHSEQSKGTNNLLKEGAIPVWNGQQIVEELQMFQMKY